MGKNKITPPITKNIIPIEQSVSVLRGVGGAFQKKLLKLNIHTIQDLLFHLPFRYEDRTKITPIGSIRPMIRLYLRGKSQEAP